MNSKFLPKSWSKATPNSSKEIEPTLLFFKWVKSTSKVFLVSYFYKMIIILSIRFTYVFNGI